jgi:AbrB family looped-hinge helix DNA binding protein
MPATAKKKSLVVEATLTSKGQVTLPSELRRRLGLKQGSRIRFSISPTGDVKVEPVRYTIEDLWRFADSLPRPKRVMSFEEMNKAKARRKW